MHAEIMHYACRDTIIQCTNNQGTRDRSKLHDGFEVYTLQMREKIDKFLYI